MNLKLKYPQQFKKQHKKRSIKPNFNPLNLRNNSITSSIAGCPSFRMKYACYVNQHLILPKKFISFLRKFLRKFFKRHNIQCWFRIQLNKVISSKSKNSRMGRGVGTINRTAFSINSHKPLFLIANISSRRLTLLKYFLSHRLPINLVIYQI